MGPYSNFSLMQMVLSSMVFLLGSADVFASVLWSYVPFTLKFLVGKCFCCGFASIWWAILGMENTGKCFVSCLKVVSLIRKCWGLFGTLFCITVFMLVKQNLWQNLWAQLKKIWFDTLVSILFLKTIFYLFFVWNSWPFSKHS